MCTELKVIMPMNGLCTLPLLARTSTSFFQSGLLTLAACCLALVLGLSFSAHQRWNHVSWIPHHLLSHIFFYFAETYPVVDLQERVLGRCYLNP